MVEGGQHFLSASHPEAVNAATVEFIDALDVAPGRTPPD